MQLSFSKRNTLPSEVVAEIIDIDVTPVMNMFIILIPFLVSMAVFTHLSVIDFSLPPNVGTNLEPSTIKPNLKITIVISKEYLAITLGQDMLDSIPNINGKYNIIELKNQLLKRRSEIDLKNDLVVSSFDIIRFEHVVKIMDIGLSAGFSNIGLSSATQDHNTK